MGEKRREAKISLIILVIGIIVGLVFLYLCVFTGKKTVTFKTNGGSIVESITVKEGNTIDEPKKPKKNGFTFAGWYLDGKEFDFDTEITKDITLVAKWIKVEEKEEETTTTTTTTKKTTTKKATKKATIAAKTTKKVTNSNGVINENTSPAKQPETQQNPSSNNNVDPGQTPTINPTPTQPGPTPDPIITPTPTITSTGMNITKDEPSHNLVVKFGATEANTNVISNLTNEELSNLLNATNKQWTAYSDNSSQLNVTLDNGVYTYTGATAEIDSISITGTGADNNTFNYVIYSKTVDNVLTWYIDKPLATLGSSDSDLNAIYYKDFKTAYKNVTDINSYITLLGNATVTSQIEVKKYITIDGGTNKYGLTTTMTDALFKLTNDLNDNTKTVTLKNVTISCMSFMDIEDNVVVKDDLLDISGSISYDGNGYKFNPETTTIDYNEDPVDPIVQRSLV